MAVNNVEIKVGQKWKNYLGKVVTVDRMTETGFLVIDEAGSTYAVNERGQSDHSAFLAIDLEALVAESEFYEYVTRSETVTLPVSFADEDATDADALASETLSALGWTFDGQCWVQPVATDWPTGTQSALDIQHGGSHYKSFAIQPVEFIHANNLPFIEGNCIKYLMRWREKGGVKDLDKVKHYVDLLIELEAKHTKAF